MSASVVTWDPHMDSLGRAVCAIGVFDGLHIGHAALLRQTVADAKTRGVASVAVTFDRDPDQIVAPATAAPQLLTLEAKLAAIGRTGIDTILVIPFTSQLATLDPDAFLERVLLRALTPVAIHVGSDFRFGRMALGDLSTLQRAGAIRGFDVVGHELVTLDGEAVTSTRIRGLIASGHIAEAVELLGGKPCVSGTVHRGRGEGRQLGFPTANVVPVPFAALPADGVYAGRATIADGSQWASAISVGTPPSFPEARDYLEAYLIGFDGDLYDQSLTIEFWDRLRDQQRYDSLDALTAAIQADTDRALEIAGFTDDELAPRPAEPLVRGDHLAADESADVDDADALEAAEQAAMHAPGAWEYEATGDWVTVGSWQFQSASAGAEAFETAMPLEAAGLPYCWSPYPPDQTTFGQRTAFTQPFELQVPAARLDDARRILAEAQRGAAEGQSASADATDADAFGVGADGEGIDDPAALEAAERAAQAYREPEPDRDRGAEEGWAEVISDTPFQKQRFKAIDAALVAHDIDHIWEPYAPDEAPLLRISFWDTERFRLSVPDTSADDASAIIEQLDDANAEHWGG